MTEVRVKEGEELNGLAAMLKDIIDTNLKDPRKRTSIGSTKGTVVVKESTSGVAVTLYIDGGQLRLENDAISRPTAHMEAGFENLAHISSGQLNPVVALLTGRLKSGGNPLLLLRISKLLALK